MGIERERVRGFGKLQDGMRAMSAYHRDHPYELEVEGVRAGIDYEPAESTTAMFGANSNWRGPVWFPLNYLVINALEHWCRSSPAVRTDAVRASGESSACRADPAWRDNVVFNEYFHGDNGAGLGAAHQTGWTGLIADVIRRRHGQVASIGDVLRASGPDGRRP